MRNDFIDIVHEDGSLDLDIPYISWSVGESLIQLDGYFDARILRAIVNHMETVRKPKEASMLKTAEEIARSVHGVKDGRLTEAGYALYQAILDYGNWRAEEVRAEQITIPPKPTTLERVAMAMANGGAAYDGWGGYTDATKAHYRTAARAGIEALRMAPNRSAYGGAWHLPGELLNAYLDSILAEKQP